MKKYLIILLFLFFSEAAFSQTQNLLLGCGENTFLAGVTYDIDTLKVDCVRTMLVQESAVVNIKHVEFVDGNTYYNGIGLNIRFGDSRDTIPREQMIELKQVDSEGNEYSDFIHPDASLPLVAFECKPPGVDVGAHVDVTGVECVTEIDENDIAAITEDTVVQLWTMLGQLYFEGKYEELYNGDCGASCLQDIYWNRLYIMTWVSESGHKYSKQVIWVR